MYKTLDSPLSVHLELTSSCNHKCRHCYNFWRPVENIPSKLLTRSLASIIIEQLCNNGVFHVTLTGGEPLSNFNVLLFTMKELTKKNISFSLNSNASLLTRKKAVAMREAGLKTILISLLSYNKKTQDFITTRFGSHERTIRGIKIAKANDLKVAVNMVVSKTNLSHVMDTGFFARNLGASSFSATRVMPPRYETGLVDPEFLLTVDDVRGIMSQIKLLLFLQDGR